jgi:hypothetical protein
VCTGAAACRTCALTARPADRAARLPHARGAARLDAPDEDVEVDGPLVALSFVPGGDDCLAHQVVARPHLFAELHGEATNVVGPKPVGAEATEDPRLQHADGEDRGEPGRACELLVVVDRVEVARGALVPDEVGAGERAVLA